MPAVSVDQTGDGFNFTGGAGLQAGQDVVYPKAQGGAEAFSLLNMTPIVGQMIPEPTMLALAAVGLAVGWRRRAPATRL